MANPLRLTELVLRDAHQSLLATRFRIEDMLPMAAQLDRIGYWSMESWGGATFDSCIRFLGEDPWERLRKIKAAMPNTPPARCSGSASAKFLPAELGKNRIDSLPIVDAHAFQAGKLPRHHRDPFDRMLVAQAQIESLGLISNDPKINLYNINAYW